MCSSPLPCWRRLRWQTERSLQPQLCCRCRSISKARLDSPRGRGAASCVSGAEPGQASGHPREFSYLVLARVRREASGPRPFGACPSPSRIEGRESAWQTRPRKDGEGDARRHVSRVRRNQTRHVVPPVVPPGGIEPPHTV